MSNGKVMIIFLIVGLMKKTMNNIKWVKTFLNHIEILEEMLKLN